MSKATQLIVVRLCKVSYYSRNFPLYQYVQKSTYSEKTNETKDTVSEDSEKRAAVNLERIRNVSRLRYHHYKQNRGEPPSSDPDKQNYCHRQTLRWRRKQFGLYGMASGINPAICFTTKEEMKDIQEYEKVTYDKSIMQLRKEALQRLAEEKEQYRIREEEIQQKLKNMQEWKDRILKKMKEKQIESKEAKQKRERLLEDVRRFFGYTIDMKDEKFQIMLELREKEEQKLQRDVKKKRREERFLAKLASLESGSDNTDKTSSTDSEQSEKK